MLPENSFVSHYLNPLSANPKKWSNKLNNSSVTADELFECVWPSHGGGA